LSLKQEPTMAVNTPKGDNARKGREEAHADQDQVRRRDGLDQAQQNLRRIHGGQEGREELQRRAAGEVMGKLILALMALSIAILIGWSAWIIV
jgi:hypothetical protein